MTFTTFLFYFLAVVMTIAAFRVITAKSPVTAVLHLILVFFNAAMLWMLLGAEFLALVLVVVYVGAVMVLFLFVVMMLDVRMDNLREGIRTYLPLGLVVGAVMALEMAFVLGSTWADTAPVFVQAGDYNNARALGIAMYTQYTFAVEIGALLLLVGMISAIALTLRRRRDAKPSDPGAAVRVKAKDRLRMVSVPSQRDVPTASASDAAVEGDKQ
ncbi:MAG: NADH-quinone oxidoreductase subunit J [Burkholderiaceae bacterium]|nr:NADH-quinone oxidoreductase subunit J [Burkholderiaceae bacterium]